MNSHTRSRLVQTYVWAVVALAAAGVAWSARADLALPTTPHNSVAGLVAFVVLGILLQMAKHRLAVGTTAGSIAFIVYLGSALVFGATWGSFVTVVVVAAALALARKRALRIAFNTAQMVLAVVVATKVYTWLGGTIPATMANPRLVAFGAMALAFHTVNSTAVSGVVALSEGQDFVEVWLRNTWAWVGYDLVASAFALGVAYLYDRSGVAGIAIVVLPILFLRHAYLVNVQLQATNRELLELMVKAIEARDPYTSGHSLRVSQLARTLATEMGIHLRETDNVATAALLHDVGKIYEDFAPILRKEGKLTLEERQVMQSHAVRGAELVGTISNLRGYVIKCVRHHHENFDGSGYPDGIRGVEIPLGARIILVADTTDAMTTDRPYRKALTYDRVVAELDKFAGKQFDPRVVAVFKRSVAVRRLVGAAPRPVEVPIAARVERREQLVAR